MPAERFLPLTHTMSPLGGSIDVAIAAGTLYC